MIRGQLIKPRKKCKRKPISIAVLAGLMGLSTIAESHPQVCRDLSAPATLVESQGIVCLEHIRVHDSFGVNSFKAVLRSLAPERSDLFSLESVEFDEGSIENSPLFTADKGVLDIPAIDVKREFGTERYTARLVYDSASGLFQLSEASIFLNPKFEPNKTWKPYGMLNPDERRGIDALGWSIPYAKLANAVYDFGAVLDDGWVALEGVDKKSGMQAALYENQTTHELVIAFRGTEVCNNKFSFSCLKEAFLDGSADALIAIGQADKQFKHAFNFSKEIVDRYQGRKITVTGHSLGGSLAQAIGASLSLAAYAFNSAPVPEEFFDDYPSQSTAEELYHSIFVLADIHDPVSNTIESGKAYLGSSHVTPLIQFDFNEMEIMPDRLADLDALRFNKHGMSVFIDHASALLTLYKGGW
jgi:predicted esterase YcpF (UPF0227 family)